MPNVSTRAWCIDGSRVACALLCAALACSAQTPKAPLLVLLGGDAKIWQSSCEQRGWQFLDPTSGMAEKGIDQRVKALAAKIGEAQKSSSVDPNRVYLAAQGNAVSTLFYIASRTPNIWTAAVAVGGSARGAIDTNRLFAANTTNLPILWLFSNKEEEPLGKKLESAGLNLEWREPTAAKPSEIFDWLAAHERDPFPTMADCETGSPLFTHCYWVEITKFDAAERNDVLDSTRVEPLGSNAALDLGLFGYNPAEPGPGVVVASLPDKYSGPLKVNDRIIALGGKELKDGAEYAQILYQTFEVKPVVVMIERGKEHLRLETRIVMSPRAETVTARVRAQYLPDMQAVEVVSRAVTQMKVTVPAAWVPVKISWNGTEVANATTAGCWLLDEQKELLTAKRCE